MRFAFLVLEEHPYGREMLRILLAHGHQPTLIIQEVSRLAFEERAKFQVRIAGQDEPPRISDLISTLQIPVHTVASHNDTQCLQSLAQFRPDLLVLGGTRIIGPHILAIPAQGTLNAHPGLLPDVRGSSSVAWSLFLDLPVGSTVHLVDAGIDTGPIVLRRQLPVRRGDSYEQIVRRVLTLSGELMAEALTDQQEGRLSPAAQDPTAGSTFRVIPRELLMEAKRRLASESYSHFDD